MYSCGFFVKHIFELFTFEVVWATQEVPHNLPLFLIFLVPDFLVVVHIGVFDSLLGFVLLEVPLLIVELLGDKFGVVLEAVTHSIYSLVDVCLHNCVGFHLALVTLLVGADHPRLSLFALWEQPFAMRIHNL